MIKKGVKNYLSITYSEDRRPKTDYPYKLASYLITEYYDPLYAHNLKSKDNKVILKYKLDKIDRANLLKLFIEIKNCL